ncbi:2-oxoglutarate ferredoxin oxidoreductase subunit beta [alpha proteobacterium BAL199]|jgi:predicted TIM-barrel enzyme|nr:2-oxoglutarate ferredoxin oxidoreductase subunit beta [alpha proteobacterium BAL199]
MARRYHRDEVCARVAEVIAAGDPIVTAGAGTGLSAKCAEIGGADLIVVYNSGWFRMNGHASIAGYLPFGNANDIVLEMGRRQILPAVDAIPVIAGICATDPTRDIDQLLEEVRAVGYAGVINFPTVGRIDGVFRRDLESVGLGFAKEAETITRARAAGLYTLSYVFSPDDARMMAKAGVDMLVPHVGLTAGGTIGSTNALGLDDAADKVQAMIEAAWEINPEIVTLAHGGPIATPQDVDYVLGRTDAHGFVGASSMERLPVEKAIIEVTRQFKAAKPRKARK